MIDDCEQRFVRTLVEDPNDPEGVVLDLGLEVCEMLGWKEGDTIEWIDNRDGTWTLKKTN